MKGIGQTGEMAEPVETGPTRLRKSRNEDSLVPSPRRRGRYLGGVIIITEHSSRFSHKSSRMGKSYYINACLCIAKMASVKSKPVKLTVTRGTALSGAASASGTANKRPFEVGR
ncbi:hypothetical protein EVAR_93782_1 [Eumeta japonica]|uniref:Uncharacterized protein n=1 Tax=Eumeta variegata TaxID=151549 RepID=A0A4C1VBT3_EUMVA|nr:hypothetical protein EVAR_93782_1 [Eumeta japonica]